METVGVGQSETRVADMTDMFLLLLLPGAGDELQGIKKGILEVADTIVINKADGDNVTRAERARREYETALHILTPGSVNWSPQVLTCSALKNTGLAEIWETVNQHRTALQAAGELNSKRKKQALDWMHFLLEEGLRTWFFNHPDIEANLPKLTSAIEQQAITPTSAASRLLRYLTDNDGENSKSRSL